MMVLSAASGVLVALWLAVSPVENSSWMVASLVTIIAGFGLLHRASHVLSPRTVTITGIFLLSYMAYIVLPGFYVYVDNPGDVRNSYLFGILSVLITVPLGALMANGILRAHRSEIIEFAAAPITNTAGGHPRIVVFMGVLFLGLCVTLWYALTVDTLPIFYLLRNPGSYADLGQLRQTAGVELGSAVLYPHYYYQMLIYPMLTILALGEYLVGKQRVWFWLFITALFMGVLHSSLTAAKSPVAQMIVVILMFLYISRRGQIKPRHVVIAIASVVAFPVAVTSMAYWGAEGGTTSVLFALGHRAFYSPSWIIYKAFEIFPTLVPPLHGRSIGRLAWVMGEPAFNVANYMANYLTPLSPIRTGNANAGFVANLNADFGMWGVIFGGIFAGGVMQALQIAAARRAKTVAVVAIVSFQTVVFTLLSHTALSAVLLSYGTVLCIGLVGAMRLAEHVLRSGSDARVSSRAVAAVPEKAGILDC